MNRIIVLYPITDSVHASEYNSEYDTERFTVTITSLFNTLSCSVGSGLRAGISRIQTDWMLLKASCNEALAALNQTPHTGGIAFSGDKASWENPGANHADEQCHYFVSPVSR